MSARSSPSPPKSTGVWAENGSRANARARRERQQQKHSPLKQSAGDERTPGVEACRDGREKASRDERVKSIHQPSVARDQAARILDSETPLERRFEQIAKLRHDRS